MNFPIEDKKQVLYVPQKMILISKIKMNKDTQLFEIENKALEENEEY